MQTGYALCKLNRSQRNERNMLGSTGWKRYVPYLRFPPSVCKKHGSALRSVAAYLMRRCILASCTLGALALALASAGACLVHYRRTVSFHFVQDTAWATRLPDQTAASAQEGKQDAATKPGMALRAGQGRTRSGQGMSWARKAWIPSCIIIVHPEAASWPAGPQKGSVAAAATKSP